MVKTKDGDGIKSNMIITEVKKRECLFDTNHPCYGDRNEKLRCWEEVYDNVVPGWSALGASEKLAAEGQCKEKWKNLRAVFVRHTKPASSGSSSKNKKPYYLADAMQFTIPFIKTLNNTVSGNLPQQAVEEVLEQEDNEEVNESQSILHQNIPLSSQNMTSPSQSTPSPYQNNPSPMSCPLPASSPITNQPLSPLSCPLSRPPASSTGSRFTRRKGKSFSTIDDGIMDYFKARKAKLDKNTIETEDPKRMFLLSLLPDMKAMSDSQTRTFKRRVLALVDEILEEPQRPSLAPSQQATSSYNLETQSVFVSTQELPSLNEQQSTAAYNFETQHVSLSTQEQPVPNGQRVTPAYNQILTYYESVPSLINTNDD